ncbi:Polycystin cation channel, PKD1/PKD2 [Ascosphaera apis ARSEF 7405]|uniref:Polycystin cation channel, PKD1/PKD2 n=1 Tax=Ascosphaera apis ARSEF 7405 TaxID=392613 RepID=A0A162ICR3_9EURO|nr:Polycystin cation channel, PKD1/PKD2 [Ascosphaera apis ARSEF 7405]
MTRWSSMMFWNSSPRQRREARRLMDSSRHLLPRRNQQITPPALPAKEVTKVALRLRYQIEQLLPAEVDVSSITTPDSPILTKEVIQTAKEAGGEELKACVVSCLLTCLRWFKIQAAVELWDVDLYECRALACDVLAKRIIESEPDQNYLMLEILLKRYSTFANGEETVPINALESAVDLHALHTIGSCGYQKCVKYLWHGWICQDDLDPSNFIEYEERVNPSYWVHFDPDRLRVPIYQNAVQISLSAIYLALYTGVINTVNPTGDLDFVEGVLYVMTLGYICDELSKLWKVGRNYFGFWNVFNTTLYALLAISFGLRMFALSQSSNTHDKERQKFNQMSYNFLAFSAPMFWCRLLLYLDTFRFFGAMLLVLKVMMKESIIFFCLLFFVIIGFLQGFLGMDQADAPNAITPSIIIKVMVNTVMTSPDFEVFKHFAPPFGILLYYIFAFVVMTILLNILIALYNSAYTEVTENSTDEYLALFSQRTMQFVRAPDENVFIAPFNLIEIVCLILPFEWWMPAAKYERLNHYVMGVIYFPILLLTALVETIGARQITLNRRLGEEDDNVLEEWEEMAEGIAYTNDEDDWVGKVEATRPKTEVDPCLVQVRELSEQISELKDVVRGLLQERQGRAVGGVVSTPGPVIDTPRSSSSSSSSGS